MNLVLFFQDLWQRVSVSVSDFFHVVSELFLVGIWKPVQEIIQDLQYGSLWARILDQFRYNSWGTVLHRLSSDEGLITTIFIIAFVILLCCGGGVVGGAIGAVLLLLILMPIMGTAVWLWENLLEPIFPLTMFVLASLGFIIGAFVSVRNYIRSVKAFRDPWKNYKDKGRFVEENAARRSYFFGPGQRQVSCIFRGAWKRNFASVGSIVRNRINVGHGFILRVILAPFVWIYLIVYIFSVLTFGSILTFLIGTVHFLVIFLVSTLHRIIFSLAWLVDRTYLVFKRISSICPHCKKKYRIPEFACPDCGKRQHNLVPSSYGIFHRKCVCGKKLPTTFFNGRSRLEPYCPSCGDTMVSSDSRQFGLTMVGASSAGKTAIITAFVHQLQELVRNAPNAECEIPTAQARKFDQLNRFYLGHESLRGSVVDETTDMYSLLLRLHRGRTRIQFSLYDVAGEVFDTPDLNAIVYANDMAISQGIIFVLDPLSAPSLKERARRSDHAAVREMSAVLNHFVTFLQTLSSAEKVGQRIKRPMAVLINKMDSPTITSWFSMEDLNAALSAVSPDRRQALQDSMCRDFLMQIGLSDFLMALDAQFSNVHFFPVSATGGADRGYAFQPSAGLMKPFAWIIRQKDTELAGALNLSDDLI